MADLGKTLIVMGVALLAVAVAWWYLFFEQIFGPTVKKASECFYYTTEICSLGEVLGIVSKIPAYSPMSFWAAIAALTTGVALLAFAPSKKR